MIAPHSSGNRTSRNVVKVALPSLEGAQVADTRSPRRGP